MKTFRFLVLTDHRGHSAQNSLYGLVSGLAQHPACSQVAVASRGNPANTAFFQELKNEGLEAHIVKNECVFQESGAQFLEKTTRVQVSDFDVLLMRLPRPISDEFLLFVATIAAQKVLINHPKGIIETSSKAFLLHFSSLCPPIRLCHSIDAILEFSKHHALVLKPLREYGGKGILRLEDGFVWDNQQKYSAFDFLKKQEEDIKANGLLAMKFLKNVTQGDKRIVVVGGTIVGAMLRMPAPDSWLCNVAQGGYAVPAEIDAEEAKIVQAISPVLLNHGIVMYGLDTLVNDDGKRVISEINTLSIGGIMPMEAQTGRPIIQLVINKIMEYVKAQ